MTSGSGASPGRDSSYPWCGFQGGGHSRPSAHERTAFSTVSAVIGRGAFEIGRYNYFCRLASWVQGRKKARLLVLMPPKDGVRCFPRAGRQNGRVTGCRSDRVTMADGLFSLSTWKSMKL